IDVRFSALSDKLLEKYTWYFGDGTTDTGRIIDHTYPAPGTYKVKLIGQAFNGKLDSSSINVLVDWPTFNPVWDKIICGIDTMHFIEPNPFFDNFKWQDNTTENFYRSWQNEYLYVTATDTTGYCKFADSAQ